jgi:mycofactocin precursor
MAPSCSTTTVGPVASVEIERLGDPRPRSRVLAGAEVGSLVDEVLVEEVLVEEVSIDGMCGVY